MDKQTNGMLQNRYWKDNGCPICGSKDINDFYQVNDMPTQAGILFPSIETAREAPVGDISLAFCQACSYIGNQLHNPAIQNHRVNQFSLQHSPSFRRYAEALAQSMIDRFDIRNKTVMDIGCGDGDFLRTLCRLGNNKGIGIDPGFQMKDRYKDEALDIEYFQDYFSEKYAGYKADFYLCRHVLNVIDDARAFVSMLRNAIGDRPGVYLYLEEPDAAYNFGDGIVWNIVYEHRTWFSRESMHNLFTLCGFETVELASCWNNEYISITSRPASQAAASPPLPASENMKSLLSRVSHEFGQVVSQWESRMQTLRASGKKIAAWGAGARCITFLNTFDLRDLISFVIDINPDRQGLYIPRDGHRVVAPEHLLLERPDVILITNPTYAEEIMAHARQLGCDCEFISL